MTEMYHVYAEDGFESAHRTEAAAIRAAKRGHATRNRKVHYKVVRTHGGVSGSGRGSVVFTTGT